MRARERHGETKQNKTSASFIVIVIYLYRQGAGQGRAGGTGNCNTVCKMIDDKPSMFSVPDKRERETHHLFSCFLSVFLHHRRRNETSAWFNVVVIIIVVIVITFAAVLQGTTSNTHETNTWPTSEEIIPTTGSEKRSNGWNSMLNSKVLRLLHGRSHVCSYYLRSSCPVAFTDNKKN